MRIENVKWEDGQGLEDFITWGIIPLKTLTYYLNEGSLEPNTKERVAAIGFMIEELIEKAEECIKRFLDELDEIDKGIDGIIIKPRENPSYMKDEDCFAAFLKECCCIDKYYKDTEETELYYVFRIWHKDNVSNSVPGKKWFSNIMSKRFGRIKGSSGRYFYDGLILKE